MILKAILLLVTIFLLCKCAFASAWLPEKGKFRITTSLMLVDSKTRSMQRQYARNYPRLLQAKTNWARLQEKFDKRSARYQQLEVIGGRHYKASRKLDDACRATEVLVTTIEHGLRNNKSMGVEALGKYRLFEREIRGGQKNFWHSAELFFKYKMFHTNKYVASWQPFAKLEVDGKIYTGASLLLGYSGTFRKWKRYSQLAITLSTPIKRQDRRNLHYSFAVAQGVILPRCITISYYAKYSREDKRNLIYAKSFYEQFSIAKEVKLTHFKLPAFTVQAGYFEDRSARYSKIKNTGVIFTTWIEI